MGTIIGFLIVAGFTLFLFIALILLFIWTIKKQKRMREELISETASKMAEALYQQQQGEQNPRL